MQRQAQKWVSPAPWLTQPSSLNSPGLILVLLLRIGVGCGPLVAQPPSASGPLHHLPPTAQRPGRAGPGWRGPVELGGGSAAALLLTSRDAIVCLSGFVASLGPRQSVLLSSHIYIDPPPSTASLLPLCILLFFITWEGRLWKWQIRAAVGEAVWQG